MSTMKWRNLKLRVAVVQAFQVRKALASTVSVSCPQQAALLEMEHAQLAVAFQGIPTAPFYVLPGVQTPFAQVSQVQASSQAEEESFSRAFCHCFPSPSLTWRSVAAVHEDRPCDRRESQHDGSGFSPGLSQGDDYGCDWLSASGVEASENDYPHALEGVHHDHGCLLWVVFAFLAVIVFLVEIVFDCLAIAAGCLASYPCLYLVYPLIAAVDWDCDVGGWDYGVVGYLPDRLVFGGFCY